MGNFCLVRGSWKRTSGSGCAKVWHNGVMSEWVCHRQAGRDGPGGQDVFKRGLTHVIWSDSSHRINPHERSTDAFKTDNASGV